jgi:hypothetical protein
MQETLRRPRVVRLKEVAGQYRADAARQMRAQMHRRAGQIALDLSGDIGGYAITVFDRRGACWSVIESAYTPFDALDFPGRVHAALNRTLAASLPTPATE